MCCFRRSVPLRVRPARLVEPPVGQVWDVVRLALRPSGDHQSPSGPSYLETGVLPGAVWGFLLLPRFVNQVLDCRAVRALPASPGPELPRARGLRRPVLAQPWEPHSGSGRPGVCRALRVVGPVLAPPGWDRGARAAIGPVGRRPVKSEGAPS